MGFELLHLSGIILVKLIAPDFTKPLVWIVSKRGKKDRGRPATYLIPRFHGHFIIENLRECSSRTAGYLTSRGEGDEGSFQGISLPEERETSKMDISDTSLR